MDHNQMHFLDRGFPIGETLEAVHELLGAGMVREIACSNFGSGCLRQASRIAAARGLRPLFSRCRTGTAC